MPNYALLPSQPLQTTIRSLRRSIGHPIHPASQESLPQSTTHVLLVRPTPCLALFAALVDPSLSLVNTENEAYTLPDESLSAGDTLPWAGSVRLSARSFWSDTGAALQGLRMSTLGALRPRGAGAAAPSTEAIRVLISRAGGIVTDDAPDVVLVAPGLSRRGAKVRKLLNDNVLCLGAGFVVDLLLRLHADPTEYVVFTEQKHLCGPVLDEAVARQGRPLPISKAVLQRSEKAAHVTVKARLKPPDLRRSKRIRRAQERDESESDSSVRKDSPSVLTKHTELSREKSKSPDNPAVVDATPAPADTDVHESTRLKSAPSSTKSRPKSSRQVAPNEASKPSFDEYNQTSDAPMREIASSKQVTSNGTPQPKRPRKMFSSIPDVEAQNKASPPSACKAKKTVPQPHDLISPTTPAENPPKRPRLGNLTTQESSPVHKSGCRTRSALTSFSDAETIPPRQLHFPLDPNCDMSLPIAPVSHGSRSPTGSRISGRVDGHTFSVDEGFRFLFARLGQPSQEDVDKLLRCIRNGGNLDDDDDGDDDDQCKEGNKDNMVTGTQGVGHRSNPHGAESPLFDEGDDAFPGFHDVYQTERMIDETLAGMDEVDTAPSQRQLSRSEAVKRGTVDAFRIPIPRRRNILSNVVLPEMAILERANEISIAEGHEVDDQMCQNSVDCLDWILGAENLIGVSHDVCYTPHKGPAVARCRSLWSSLFESNALRQFAAPNGTPDSDIRILTGVCIRLLSSGLADDMKVSLSETLLIVRDEQVRAGFDSLQTVLSSRDLDNIPFRHKALAAIWTTLVQSSIISEAFTGAWEVLNGALIPRVDCILNLEKFKEIKRPQYLEKELNNVLQSLVLSSYMFSTRLDFNLGDGTDERDSEEARLHPEGWALVCRCMDKLCEVASSHEYRSAVLIMSTSLLRIAAVSIGRKVWPVTDKVVASATKLVTTLSSLNGKNCFCAVPPMIVNQFRNLVDDSDSETRLSGELKTMCDYLFLLGWLYTVRGQGNPMKRAMNMIRSGYSFTRVKPDCPGSPSQSINHHVGLLLTVADSLACSAKDGEYLLCKMLTSKCRRPNSIAERLSSHVGEQGICWRATLQAISKRCEVLLARQLSVHVYTNWLSQNLTETLCLIRRSSERRSANLSEKEALRAQDSIFCNLAMLMMSSLTHVNKSMTTCLKQDHALGEKIIRDAVEKPAAQISTWMKVSGDLLSQIRSNPEESRSKNRHGLLCALLSLVESQIVLVRHLLAPPVPNETGSVGRISGINMLEESALSFITDTTTEHIIVNVVGGGQPIGEESSLRNAMRPAAGMLAHLIELRSIRSGQGIQGNEDNHTAFLQRANMDMTFRFEGGPQRGVPMKAIVPEVEDSNRLAFWTQAVKSTWILSFLQRRGRSHVMCVSAAVSLLACMTDGWDAEDCAAIFQLGIDCARLEPLRYAFEPIQTDVMRLGENDHPLARVGVVEKALRLVVKHWPTAQVHGLLKLLDCRLKRIIGSRSSTQSDALILYSFMHAVSAQLGGFTHARFLHSPLSDIAQAITRMANSARDHSKTFHFVQSRVLSALCMATSDMETRVLVLRVANAFPASDTLPGLWGAPLLPTDEVPEEWTRRAERHAQEWRAFVFTSVIEDPLFAGRNVAYAVRRLAAAAKGGDPMRRLVQSLLARGRGKLDFLLRRDGRAWRDWAALCDQLLEA